MAKISEILSDSNETLFSIEILPPLKGESISELYERISPLMEMKPKFVDVTYHREEYVYKQKKSGLLEKRVVRKRPGTVGICAAIMNKFQVETVPHIICGGFSKEETENALIDLNFLGIHNVLALRGDAIKSESRFVPDPEGHNFATGLVQQIQEMNQGKYLDDDMKNANKTEFCIGVAGYPEKHFEAPNLLTDLKYLKDKVDLGADYIVTQMFFDNQKFFEFVDKCREVGINVPIIPGLKPITSKRHLSSLPSFFHIDLPDELSKAIDSCRDNTEAKRIGIEWCIEQSKELKSRGVPCLHYYSMGRGKTIQEIASAVF